MTADRLCKKCNYLDMSPMSKMAAFELSKFFAYALSYRTSRQEDRTCPSATLRLEGVQIPP